ncbi:membrane protein insertase YidC [Patescibacteria group bacterium]|nr:membrane protein insertase YidC [Patescibacteria group bacterium]
MEILIQAFNTILYQPLLNVLVLLYEYLPGHDFGVAVIVLTILIKLLFYPLGIKAIKSQKALSGLQPKVKEIQEKYKDNKGQQTREIMALYKKEKINPFSGCLPVLIQLPVLLALYRVFWHGLQPEQMVLLYNFVPLPGTIAPTFLGIVNLAQPNIIMAFLAGIFQFLQTKLSIPKIKSNKTSGFSGQMQKQMQYFMPAFMVLILFRLPSAIGLYWLTTTLFTIVQQYVIFRKKND